MIINPKAYLPVAEGLYLDSHHLEKNDAKAIIKNEFKILNQLTKISTSFALISATLATTTPLSKFCLIPFALAFSTPLSLK